MYELHLFAGAGGGILGGLLSGKIPIGAVEVSEYEREVLTTRQIEGDLPEFPIWDDVKTFGRDAKTKGYLEFLRAVRGSLCISAGFPCQDISVAGKGAGISGSRSRLWEESARIVEAIRPAEIFLENSPVIRKRGGVEIVRRFAELGYFCTWGTFSASQIGAHHKRARWWCLGLSDADDEGINRRFGSEKKGVEHGPLDEGGKARIIDRLRIDSKPGVGGVSDGLAHWLDENTSGEFWNAEEKGLPRIGGDYDRKTRAARIRAAGNGQVPLCCACAYLILKDLAEALRNA